MGAAYFATEVTESTEDYRKPSFPVFPVTSVAEIETPLVSQMVISKVQSMIFR